MFPLAHYIFLYFLCLVPRHPFRFQLWKEFTIIWSIPTEKEVIVLTFLFSPGHAPCFVPTVAYMPFLISRWLHEENFKSSTTVAQLAGVGSRFNCGTVSDPSDGQQACKAIRPLSAGTLGSRTEALQTCVHSTLSFQQLYVSGLAHVTCSARPQNQGCGMSQEWLTCEKLSESKRAKGRWQGGAGAGITQSEFQTISASTSLCSSSCLQSTHSHDAHVIKCFYKCAKYHTIWPMTI